MTSAAKASRCETGRKTASSANLDQSDWPISAGERPQKPEQGRGPKKEKEDSSRRTRAKKDEDELE